MGDNIGRYCKANSGEEREQKWCTTVWTSTEPNYSEAVPEDMTNEENAQPRTTN